MWRSIFLVVALGLSARVAAEDPRLTGLARWQGVDSAWLWFPGTGTSLVLRRGEARNGYRLLEVDHVRGWVRLETSTGLLAIGFGAAAESGVAVAAAPSATTVSRRASQNAARALGLQPGDVPGSGVPPPTIDQIAAQARRRLNPLPPP